MVWYIRIELIHSPSQGDALAVMQIPPYRPRSLRNSFCRKLLNFLRSILFQALTAFLFLHPKLLSVCLHQLQLDARLNALLICILNQIKN